VSDVYQAMASLPSRLAMAGKKDMDHTGSILMLEPVHVGASLLAKRQEQPLNLQRLKCPLREQAHSHKYCVLLRENVACGGRGISHRKTVSLLSRLRVRKHLAPRRRFGLVIAQHCPRDRQNQPGADEQTGAQHVGAVVDVAREVLGHGGDHRTGEA
jgi:hypothetical protein